MQPRLFDPYNAAYAQALFERYLQNPASVDDAWRRVFESGIASGELIGAAAAVDGGVAPTEAQLRVARAAGELVDAYRLHGHTAAHLDPLGSAPPGHPALNPEFHGITAAELTTVPASMLGLGAIAGTVADLVDWLKAIYTGSIGYEYEYLEDPGRREWLREQIESGSHREPLTDSEKRRLLVRLTDVESLEQFIHRTYLGAKRFSIEGLDMLVPMLDLAVERAAAAGADEIVIGMAHRGRLNVLAHLLGMPYAELIAKFEGRHAMTAGTGDVKYHLGAEGTYATASGEPLTVRLAPNPSHLEFVNPVVEGMARAKQSDRFQRQLQRHEERVLPVLIHGDAAFSAQGVVAETLNLARLEGYRTGGTLHLIANNQIGFTTDPRDARSTDYASDLARGFDVPIFHVNADDPEACLAVIRLAMAFREEFHGDVVIDVIGYRRYGHNEGDEPAYTQPVMYNTIAAHDSVRKLWAAQLIAYGGLSEDDAETIARSAHDRLLADHDRVKAGEINVPDHAGDAEQRAGSDDAAETAVSESRLLALDRQLHEWPDDFKVNPKLVRQLERRAAVLSKGGAVDFAHAESLAFATLLAEGVPIRMSGQDTERGTFSQRHLALHDVETGTKHIPLANLDEAAASFEIYNSPLSELAALGFEYGFSVVAPKTLVLWEAQFGDFVNSAQVILDQFLVAGREKWGQESRLALLLPHGYEGQGPEHSSARIERFLQLAAEGNVCVANCTLPAQYFHLLRRQALLEQRRPLVVITPKSLLRHPKAKSTLDDLTTGTFQVVIDDPAIEDPGDVRRIVLCSGKVYYDLLAARDEGSARDPTPPSQPSTAGGRSKEPDGGAIALVRVEQLYPFPDAELKHVLERYAEANEIVWAQEEPRNMGAWFFMEPRLEAVTGSRIPVRYAGRVERASPAEGYATDHETEQTRIVAHALESPAARRRDRRAGTGSQPRKKSGQQAE